MKTIQAIGKNVIVKLNERKAESDGGIIIPELSREVTTEGTVLTAGREVEGITVGDIVGVPKHLGTLAVSGGAEVVIIDYSKLLYVRMTETGQA